MSHPADLQLFTVDVRPRPPLFRALGHAEPPNHVEINGHSYELARIFKHDSWAATALYESRSGQVVCKFNRQQRIGPFPMRWLGRLLARHEAAMLHRLSGLANVPRFSGEVIVDGKRLPFAVAHDYIPGHALGKNEYVDAEFLTRLRTALRGVHQRDVAYVDLHKRENILVGDDGQPYLVDFQIGFALPRKWPGNSLIPRGILKMLQRSDDYHLDKHARSLLPASQTASRASGDVERPWWIRVHRMFAQPFRTFRRWLLVTLRIRDGNGRAASELFPEQAVRDDRDAAVTFSCSRRTG